MTFKIITLGCKVNTYESEFMLENLLRSGYIYSEEKPDIIIINTCSVTNMADKKSKKMVRRARRENKDVILVVAGCSTQNAKEEYENMGIDILIGNSKKSKIVELINNYQKTHEPYNYFTQNRDLDFENMTVEKFTTHTRAFIKIQDGCNNFCSYCIIPYVRGNIRSKKFADVFKEAEVLVANGHKEIGTIIKIKSQFNTEFSTRHYLIVDINGKKVKSLYYIDDIYKVGENIDVMVYKNRYDVIL